MPYHGEGFDYQTPEEMAHTSCIVSQSFARYENGGFWSAEVIAVCAAYVLIPALILVLVAGYAGALRSLVSSYVDWLKHGKAGVQPAADRHEETP